MLDRPWLELKAIHNFSLAMTGGISLICDTKTTFLVWRALVIAVVSEIVVHEVDQFVYAIRGMSDL